MVSCQFNDGIWYDLTWTSCFMVITFTTMFANFAMVVIYTNSKPKDVHVVAFSIPQLPYLEQCTTTTKEHHVPLVLVCCYNAMTVMNEHGLPLFRLLQHCDNNDHRGVWCSCDSIVATTTKLERTQFSPSISIVTLRLLHWLGLLWHLVVMMTLVVVVSLFVCQPWMIQWICLLWWLGLLWWVFMSWCLLVSLISTSKQEMKLRVARKAWN